MVFGKPLQISFGGETLSLPLKFVSSQNSAEHIARPTTQLNIMLSEHVSLLMIVCDTHSPARDFKRSAEAISLVDLIRDGQDVLGTT